MTKQNPSYRPFGGGYVSDFEQFMNSYLDQHPEVEADRKHGWLIWWDHRLDLAELDKQRESEVAVRPYRYA